MIAGYSAEDVKLAGFALVAFLDESVLASGNPVFADWPAKPLQEELFGTHVAGRNLLCPPPAVADAPGFAGSCGPA